MIVDITIMRVTFQPLVCVVITSRSHFHRYFKVTIRPELLDALLPGPVTLLFERLPSLNPDFNSFAKVMGKETIIICYHMIT